MLGKKQHELMRNEEALEEEALMLGKDLQVHTRQL